MTVKEAIETLVQALVQDRKLDAVTEKFVLRALDREDPQETWTLFKFCQNCHTVLTHDVHDCPVCKNPRVQGNCSQVWLRSRGLVDV